MRIKEMIATMFAVFVILIFSDIAEIRAENQVALQALQEAKELKDWHKFDEAIAAYRNIVSSYSGTDEADQAQIEIGNIYAERGMFDEAIKEYQKVIGQYSPQIKKSMASLQAASSSKEPQPIDVKKYPGLEKMAVVHRATEGLIYCYLEKEEYEKAIQSLREEHNIFQSNTLVGGYEMNLLGEEIKKRKVQSPDRRAIRKLVKDYVAAMNSRDIQAIKSFYIDSVWKKRDSEIEGYIRDHVCINWEVKTPNPRIEIYDGEAFVEVEAIFKEEPSDGLGFGWLSLRLKKMGDEWKICGE